ncbi:MAG TPA: fused MFS/spermidine synthase [Pirellulales bacterium]|nr:fused MFS/spermidine synthase [Pirellulales bacterium]
MSLGGVIGGLFNALVAPLVFTRLIEYPLAMVCACALSPPLRGGRVWWAKLLDDDRAELPRFRRWELLVPLVVGLVAGAIYFYWPPDIDRRLRIVTALALCVACVERPICFGLCIGAVICATTTFYDLTGHVQYRERSFYGLLKVTQSAYPPFNFLIHGQTLHGAQLRDGDPKVRDQALVYFHRTGPMGQVFDALDERLTGRKLAIVGLGVGSLAAYGQTGQELTFFEIDPVVERVARDDRYFTFLRDCTAKVRVVLGDARLELAHEPDAEFALIVVDAFSGDAVPAHLLTREALALYRRKLAPGGVIAFHISNSYLRLAPVLGNLAESAGMVGLDQDDVSMPTRPQSGMLGKMASHWIVIAQDRKDLGPLTHDPRWQPLAPDHGVSLWTDDFSNLLEVFEWPESQR